MVVQLPTENTRVIDFADLAAENVFWTAICIRASSSRGRGPGERERRRRPSGTGLQADGGCQTVLAVLIDILLHRRGCWLILMKGERRARRAIFIFGFTR